MQWHLAFMHCQAASNLGIAQSAGTADSYSLCASLNGAEYCLFHGSPVSNAALNLFGYCFGDQAGIKFRLTDLLDIEPNLFPDELFKVSAQFINSLASTPDDNARPGGMDGYRYVFRLTFNFHQRQSCVRIFVLDGLPQLQIFLQSLGVVSIGVPPGLPVLYDANSKAYGMNLTTQLTLLVSDDNCNMARTFKDAACPPPSSGTESFHSWCPISKDTHNL